MEDINILKELFFEDESYEPNGYVETYFHKEQLEKENKELKRKYNAQPVMLNNSMYFIDSEVYENLLVDIRKNYIPKSVIRDKIEELENNREEFRNYEEISKDLNEKIFWHSQFREMVIAINALKEILGEEK